MSAHISKRAKLAETGPSDAKPKRQIATISIAVPGSILDNAQSAELRSYLGGQIARAACAFNVNEIIVFNDGLLTKNTSKSVAIDSNKNRSCVQMARLLQYLECPQYLRKFFFPIHQDLQYAGILNPLDAPHHLREDDEFLFREGVTTNKPMKTSGGSIVNVGLKHDVTIDKKLPPGLRVTVRLENVSSNSKRKKGTVVSPETPQIESNTYWGYSVRIANTFSEVFHKQTKYQYDVVVGTSDKGDSVDVLPLDLQFQHLLIVFGGLNGLEFALENDEAFNVNDVRFLFDYYINVIPNQGSRTIRTEEAVLISLTKLLDCNRLKPFQFK